MLVDEFWFHHRRGLPRWERWGHPLDTFTVMLCYGLALSPATRGHTALFVGAALFSTLFVTKDEWVHVRVCCGSEMWLHACLFALHPVMLFLAGAWAWASVQGNLEVNSGLEVNLGTAGAQSGLTAFGNFLVVQSALTVGFFLYQCLYWNGPWSPAYGPDEKDRGGT